MPPFPAILSNVWRWFIDLSATRSGGFGPGPITFVEIEAYSRLMRVRMAPWEVALIRRLDQASAGAVKSRQPKATKDANGAIPVSDTASLKAMFRGIATRKASERAGGESLPAGRKPVTSPTVGGADD